MAGCELLAVFECVLGASCLFCFLLFVRCKSYLMRHERDEFKRTEKEETKASKPTHSEKKKKKTATKQKKEKKSEGCLHTFSNPSAAPGGWRRGQLGEEQVCGVVAVGDAVAAVTVPMALNDPQCRTTRLPS